MVITKSDLPGIRIRAIYGAELPLTWDENVAGVAAHSVVTRLPAQVEFDLGKQGLELEIFKAVMPGSGIGSSAASAAASRDWE